MQVQFSSGSHFQFGYFDLVNTVDQVKHGSQGSDYKFGSAYICSRHAQDQYYGFSFSLASDCMISDYYHFIIGQIILLL